MYEYIYSNVLEREGVPQAPTSSTSARVPIFIFFTPHSIVEIPLLYFLAVARATDSTQLRTSVHCVSRGSRACGAAADPLVISRNATLPVVLCCSTLPTLFMQRCPSGGGYCS